jgi:hypothetical protein
VKRGTQKGGQDLSHSVNDRMRRDVRAGTHMEDRKHLREGVDGQPEHLLMVAEPCSEFVQLQVCEVEARRQAGQSRGERGGAGDGGSGCVWMQLPREQDNERASKGNTAVPERA